MMKDEQSEYIVIGAGPAAICALAKLLEEGVNAKTITWIDPEFKVGDFGSKLSVGSSVPGNTNVESYQRVNRAIFHIISSVPPAFEIDNLAPEFVCSLKVAAEPMQYITDELRKLIHTIEGHVAHIETLPDELKVEVNAQNNTLQTLTAKRVIIATGSKPKSIKLPERHHAVTLIDPNIVFIQSELVEFLRQHPTITTVAVIGSSHSAALAAMHLLQAGVTVHQYMNKEYKYAKLCITPEGVHYTMYDNTGLKGEVAKFTKKMLADIEAGNSIYQHKITFHRGKNTAAVNLLLEKNLDSCSHAVATIGYESLNSMHINNKPLMHLKHNHQTTEFYDMPGLYGIGIAFPQELNALSGEIEFAVGYGKFWTTVSNKDILVSWKK